MTNNDYKKHYERFRQNVHFVARTWHGYVHLNNRAAAEETVLNALNRAPRYWLDQRYIAIQTTIIFLGKIFDYDARAYSIDKLNKILRNWLGYFNRSELRKRKIDLAGEFEGIDAYINNAHELGKQDLEAISTEVKKARKIWERIAPLRKKFYAHDEMLSDDERKDLFLKVKNADIDDLIQILLNISNALWEAEWNGRKPDLTVNFTQPIDAAKENIDELVSSLLHP